MECLNMLYSLNSSILRTVNAARIRSQVFSVISKILSHSEDEVYEEGMLGAIHESFHSILSKVQAVCLYYRARDGTTTKTTCKEKTPLISKK